MTLAIILNVVSMTLLLVLLAATMRVPFRLASGERVEARVRRRRAAGARRPAKISYRAAPAEGSLGN